MASHTQPLEIIRALTSEKRKSIDLLDAAIAMLKERLEDESEQPVGAPVTLPVAAMSRRIFVVHGHDDGQKETIARYLENIAFEPIILHERPNKGRTIIEKFRDEAADVGFAIALLTPDDAMADDNGSAKKRARQNVIFELGFFLGALGPGKVVALVKGPVEMPSDYHGVIYIPVDDGSWKMKVAQELQAANYDIDWNRVMR